MRLYFGGNNYEDPADPEGNCDPAHVMLSFADVPPTEYLPRRHEQLLRTLNKRKENGDVREETPGMDEG